VRGDGRGLEGKSKQNRKWGKGKGGESVTFVLILQFDHWEYHNYGKLVDSMLVVWTGKRPTTPTPGQYKARSDLVPCGCVHH